MLGSQDNGGAQAAPKAVATPEALFHGDRLARSQVFSVVEAALAEQPVVDMHTHAYPATFGTPVPNGSGRTDPDGLMLWGIDELITYHYLVAEVYRVVPPAQLPYERFWALTKTEQADHIWKHLFLERTPLSEACRGILTTIKRLGLDPADGLPRLRRYFAEQDPDRYIDRVMELAGIEKITMTNAVFDDNERCRWLERGPAIHDSRFSAVLRIDPLLRDWPSAARQLTGWGYAAGADLDRATVAEARRFLADWITRMRAIYLAVSLPPEFRYPAHGDCDAAIRAGQSVLERVILPVCAERGLPFAMMIGSRLRVNPGLRAAGDMEGKADVASVVALCRDFPENRFLVTMLSREDQHELVVAARKFSNLMVFGCWWFLNNPSLVEEVTRMRVEMLGTSFIPQHSDARVLDQLIYKWDHSRRTIARVLAEKYEDLIDAGWPLRRSEIVRDVRRLLRDNFVEFVDEAGAGMSQK
jgi:hypothetical protein